MSQTPLTVLNVTRLRLCSSLPPSCHWMTDVPWQKDANLAICKTKNIFEGFHSFIIFFECKSFLQAPVVSSCIQKSTHSHSTCFFHKIGHDSLRSLRFIKLCKNKYASFTIALLHVNHSYGLHHDDVIKWKHFLRYWTFVRGNHRSSANSPHKASDAELWCFLWSAPE